jgi:hypothetical protein
MKNGLLDGTTGSSVSSDSLSSLKKLSGSEMVSRDMSIVSSLVRSLPSSFSKEEGGVSSYNSNKMVKPIDLMDALDAAINCSLRI